MTGRCAQCAHWHALNGVGCIGVDDDENPMFGECRVSAPRIVDTFAAGRVLPTPPGRDLWSSAYARNLTIEDATAFPVTTRAIGCGEFAPTRER